MDRSRPRVEAIASLRMRRPGGLKWTEYLSGYAFILPALTGITLFGLLPLAYAFYVSFRRYDLLAPTSAFIGFANYQRVIADPTFWRALLNTAYYAGLLIPAQTGLGLMLALLVQKNSPGISIFRASYYLPVVSSMVVASTLWRIMYDAQNGIFNSVLLAMGLPAQPFLTSPSQAIPALVLMMTWKWVGISMLILLGGLNAIPADYYEAAEVDGGTPFQSFKLITLPLLRRVLLFIVVINTINAFKLFTPIYVITRGGPMESTLTLVFHIFRTGFRYYDMGAASTMSVLLLLLVLGLTLAQFGLLRSERDM